MAFNIQDFSARINSGGLAKNNLFLCRITPPAALNMQVVRDVPFLCKSSSIPGMDLSVTEIKKQGWGHKESLPSDYQKGAMSVVVMVDSNFAVKTFFHRWMQLIMNYNNLKGANSRDASGKEPFMLAFKESYVGVVDIVVYSDHVSDNFNKQYIYRFTGAYPVTLGPIEVAWENSAEIMVMVVNFSYDEMLVDGMMETTGFEPASVSSFGQSGITSGRVSSLPPNIQDTVNRFTAPLTNIFSPLKNSIQGAKDAFNRILK